jgi:hypothetical protein
MKGFIIGTHQRKVFAPIAVIAAIIGKDRKL